VLGKIKGRGLAEVMYYIVEESESKGCKDTDFVDMEFVPLVEVCVREVVSIVLNCNNTSLILDEEARDGE
jgi:hypothetical protein